MTDINTQIADESEWIEIPPTIVKIVFFDHVSRIGLIYLTAILPPLRCELGCRQGLLDI